MYMRKERKNKRLQKSKKTVVIKQNEMSIALK